MKTKPRYLPDFYAGSRIPAAALLALGLTVCTASAQSSDSTSSSTGSSQSNPSMSEPSPSNSSGAYDPTRPGAQTDNPNGAYDSSSPSRTRHSSDDTSLKHGDKRFITKAAESSQREIALSQLAATRAANPQIRNYALQLVSGHAQLTQDLVQLAQRKGIALDDVAVLSPSNVSGGSESTNAGVANGSGAPRATGSSSTASTSAGTGAGDRGMNASTSTSASSQVASNEAGSDRHYRSLAKKSGADFDKEYVDLMVKEHKSDVKLFEKAAKGAEDSEIRSFASRQLPALQAHLDQASTLGKTAAE